MHEQTNDNEHLTLPQAAKIAPGRPSANCVWRWCREGVKSRSGERVRLKHIRVGGRIYTTREWIETFGVELADADAQHFERSDEPAPPTCRSRRNRQRAAKQSDALRRQHDEAAKRLKEAGL